MKRIRIPNWIYLSFVTFVAGFVFLCKAPSTVHRIAFYNEVYNVGKLGLNDYFYRAINVLNTFFATHRFYVIISLCCIFLGGGTIKNGNKIQTKKDILLHGEILGQLLLSALSCGALIMSPYFEVRAFLLTDFFLLVCIMYFSDLFLSRIKRLIIIKYVVAIALVGALYFCMRNIYSTYKSYNDFCVRRQNAIELSNENVFYWKSYYEVEYSRILTTRENYLLGYVECLESYYLKDIYIADDENNSDGF